MEAALRLFAERGIDATSMDAIAEASGVSKATIYKHWADKNTLCLEALARGLGIDQEPPRFLGGDIRTSMIEVLTHRSRAEYAERYARLGPHLMAYAARNQAFGLAWRSRVMEPPRQRLKQLLKQGIAEGLFPADLNYELSLALLIGPTMYGYFLSPTKNNIKTLPVEWPEQIVEAFWKSHALAQPAQGGAREIRRSKKKNF
ncbi:MAG TPA: TetR/AcrR family transcriptional regulator [Blastocatellia bacterium]|nr:TetR/AcrR family transcriptional regulator [Blastocatellia bacterium]HMZ19527.1 TetR/AcrR family transcriptional regulator [Blastocatellia bacterium]HNG31117.1 TetR/AcrR family transcriptional regulator [Blastocatellia bacterium]